MEATVPYLKDSHVDRVTRLRLWAEAENISKDAIECAITYKRNHAPSMSDPQVQFLAISINASFWKAFEKGVKLGRDMETEGCDAPTT